AREGRQVRLAGRAERAGDGTQRLHRAAGGGDARGHVPAPVRLAVAFGEHGPGPGADDRPAGGLPLAGGFEQERAAGPPVGGQPAIEGDGGVLVGEQAHAHGDHALAGREGAERLAVGDDHAERVALAPAHLLRVRGGAVGVGTGGSGSGGVRSAVGGGRGGAGGIGRRGGGQVAHAVRSVGSRTTASRSPSSKQVSVPRWQAAPTWSTRTSRVSASQSRATERTHWTWPLVSPLRQYSPRERDQ